MLAQLEWVQVRVKAQNGVWRLNTGVFHLQCLLNFSSNSCNYMAHFCCVFAWK